MTNSPETRSATGSSRFALSAADIRKWLLLIGKIAFAGILSCVSLWLGGVDGGFWGPMLTVIASSLLDLSHRFVSDTRPKEPAEPTIPPPIMPPWMYPPPNSNFDARGNERSQ